MTAMPLRRAEATDMDAVARLFRTTRTACLPFLPVLHSAAEDLAYFAGRVFRTSEIWLAEEETLLGFVARREGWIDHLYVAPDAQGHGVGTALLARATEGQDQLSLWAFQKNAEAQRFYLARGWRPARHTDGANNEEREPDTLFTFNGPPVPTPLELVAPRADLVPDYIAAMLAGWSPSTTRDITGTEIAALRDDAAGHLRSLAVGEGMVTLEDGSRVPRLPGQTCWLWDGAFCGSINFRHVPGSEDLPPHVSGHIGYSVVPWKRRRGHATRALALLLADLRASGIGRLKITCDEGNAGSQAVIERNGGEFVGLSTDGHGDGTRKMEFLVTP